MSAQGWRLAGALIGLAAPLFLISELPATAALFTLALLTVFLMFWPSLRWFAFVLTGFVLCCAQLANLLARQLPQSLEGEDLKLTVEISSLPEKTDLNTRFEAKVIALARVSSSAELAWSERIRISWYQAPDLRVGERWQLLVRLKRPRGFVNPGVFDYQAWLLSHKIFATGYVRQAQDNQLLAAPDISSTTLLFEKLREHINQGLFPKNSTENSRFMRALLIGDKTGIEQADWQVLQNTGTLHLMAISGLHVGLIAALGFVFGKIFARLVLSVFGSRRWLFFTAPVCSVLCAFIYAGLAAFLVPTQRALLFVLLVNVAYLCGRRIDYFYALLLCACVIALYDPFVFLSAGFYLSFGAVAVLFWCFMGRSSLVHKRSTRFIGFFKAQVVLFAGLFLPLSLLALPVSLSGLVANSIAIPLVGMLVVPLLFLSSFLVFISAGAAQALLRVVDFALDLLWQLLEFFAQFEVGHLRYPLFDPALIVALAMLAFVVLVPRALALRFLALSLLVLILFLPKPENNFELTVLDVGQGLAVYVAWPNGNLLYDTGARFSEDFDIGSRVIVPWLQNKNVSNLDLLVVSHGDNDHAGGLQGVLSAMPVSQLWLGSSVKNELLKQDFLPCNNDIDLRKHTDLTIKVLWPEAEGEGFENKGFENKGFANKVFEKSNNSSCVLLLEYKELKILLTGDIEKEVEYSLLAAGTLPQNVDLLIAPHHGSRSSSTQAFIDRVQPRAVVFSAGYRNRYHHPNIAVSQRYERVGAQLYRTDLDGAITFVTDTEGALLAQRTRVDKARAWFW